MINLTQNEDITNETDSQDISNGVFEYSMLQNRIKMFEIDVSKVSRSAFMCTNTNSCLGWSCNAASPLCSYDAIHLQLKAPDIKVTHLIDQNNSLWKLNQHRTNVKYPIPTPGKQHNLSVAVLHMHHGLIKMGRMELYQYLSSVI